MLVAASEELRRPTEVVKFVVPEGQWCAESKLLLEPMVVKATPPYSVDVFVPQVYTCCCLLVGKISLLAQLTAQLLK